MLQNLSENQIKIWSIRVEETTYSRLKPYFYVLSPEEKEKADNFKVKWGSIKIIYLSCLYCVPLVKMHKLLIYR